ncbi:hypothetical protein [Cellulomonas sp. P5_E12]
MVDTMVRRDAVRAPAWPAIAALAVAVVSVAAALVSVLVLDAPSVPLLVAGYVLGAVVTTIVASVYRAMRSRRRPDPRFRPQPWLDRLATSALVIGVAAGLVNAFLLATELAK